MRYRPIGRDPVIPDDWQHVEKYPLTALPVEARPTRIPVVIGVNWYAEFDHPEKDSSGNYFIAKGGLDTLTTIRGGHCVCLEPGGEPDQAAWRTFYNQGHEGACVGFEWSRCMSILNKDRYAARWLWDQGKIRDQWPETNPGDNQGTSVRAAAEALVAAGHVPWVDSYADDDFHEREQYTPVLETGIKAFRWAKSVDDVHAVLANPRADKCGAVPILNSWGSGLPHRVWLPDAVLERLMKEEGEIAIPTDR
jgi:hypothetical protein